MMICVLMLFVQDENRYQYWDYDWYKVCAQIHLLLLAAAALLNLAGVILVAIDTVSVLVPISSDGSCMDGVYSLRSCF